MKNFVLIHGACHGGWCWTKVAEQLRSHDFTVYTPTLTGMGERVHLLNESVTIQTHIDDIVNVLRYEDLSDVILVGHSYAGLIIPAVNEAVPEKISQLIFLDSYIPAHGKTGFEILEKEYQDSWQYVAQVSGNGWRMPAGEDSLDIWGVKEPEIRKFLLFKITDFSINFLRTPIFFTKHFENVKKSYIRCTQPCYVNDLMLPFYHQAKNQGWPIYKIDTGHEPMLTTPTELTKILLEIAG